MSPEDRTGSYATGAESDKLPVAHCRSAAAVAAIMPPSAASKITTTPCNSDGFWEISA